MAQQDIIQITRSLYDLFNQRNFDQALKFISPQFERTDMSSGVVFVGHEGYLQYDQGWLTAFPDGKIQVKSIIASGDDVVIEFTGRGKQTGPLNTPAGIIPPSGKTVELNLCDIFKFKDGLLIQARSYYDSASLLRQLGAIGAKRAA